MDSQAGGDYPMKTGDRVRVTIPPTFAPYVEGKRGEIIEVAALEIDYYIVQVDGGGLYAFTADAIEPEHAMQAAS